MTNQNVEFICYNLFLPTLTHSKFKANQFIHQERQKRSEKEIGLKEIAADEIDEVDSIMEDITDEILDLQQVNTRFR